MSVLSEALANQKATLNEGLDSITERATRAGHQIDRSTIHRYLSGQMVKRPSEKVIQALAAGFQMSPQEIRHLLDVPPGAPGPWVPTAESARLDRDQRDALDQLIKAIVKGGTRDGQQGAEESSNGRVADLPSAGEVTPNLVAQALESGLGVSGETSTGGREIVLPGDRGGTNVEQPEPTERHQDRPRL